MSLALKVLAALALVWVVMTGVQSCQAHYQEQGRVEVRKQWRDADNDRISLERQAALDKQATERQEEQRMARAAEEKALEQSKRDEQLRDRAQSAERRVIGLLGKLAALDTASGERRAQGTCPAADAEADEAAKARAVLGRCASRYRSMGERAAELANQVTGLQDHVVIVQPESAALLELMP